MEKYHVLILQACTSVIILGQTTFDFDDIMLCEIDEIEKVVN